ncbi:hypothetical protein [Halomicrobium urmianum]|uniref:hypothetical protein n=1 Tax=Halomicrobium urmianum TaxID=1586233 RepID=UPI001CD94283|nr:hypothetical protein [Halomicrobium urmianum]
MSAGGRTGEISPSVPFIDPRDGTVDLVQVIEEALPLAKLIGLFALVAFVPFAIGFLLAPSGLALPFTVLGQFVVAVGAGVVLIYQAEQAECLGA